MTPVALNESDTDQGKIEEIQRLTAEANRAQGEFLNAQQDFNLLSLRDAELMTDLLDAALRMHAAKVRVSQALAAVRQLTGMIR